MTEADAAAMGCEWAYVLLHVDGRPTMRILSSYRPDGVKMIGAFGSGDPESKWREMAAVDLSAPAPDWHKIG